MKQPLQLTVSRIPPAQAEALYDTAFDPDRMGTMDGRASTAQTVWPGEDWEDEVEAGTDAGSQNVPIRPTRQAVSVSSAA